MKTRGLAVRILAAAVLCGLVGFVAARIASNVITRVAVLRFHDPLAGYVWVNYERARCETSPQTWSMSLDHGAKTFAYDPATRASLNPEAPPLDVGLLGRALAAYSHEALETRGLTLASGGALVRSTGEKGPCGAVQTTWPAQRLAPSEWLNRLSLGTLLAALAAAVVGFFLLVRPVERIERHLRQLQDHLADVAHDFKTPISSLQLALERAAGAHPVETKPLLASALGDVVYLNALTSNLRYASEIREGWNPGAPGLVAELGDVVERVVTRARLYAKQRDIEVDSTTPDADVRAGCDPVAAEQALSNVVENAITHGEAGGHVAVLLEHRDGRFTLTVVDDGPGVAPSELPRLGERTFRSDRARQRDPRGSGLGLAITAEIASRCGWSIAFAPESPRGLRVTIAGRVV
jgi:signal transduction histidine kinase